MKKSVSEYKQYIWQKVRSSEVSLDQLLAHKPTTSNSNWNIALTDAHRWALAEKTKARTTIGKSKPNRTNPKKVNGPLRWSKKMDPAIAKAILNIDARATKDSRPKKERSKSRPPTFMGERLH
ncbi:hypothetical protein N9L91_04295 [Pseudomonadales bacterium]|nr:hypothetical protein [Pseudomonadales bacterium]